MSNFNPIENWLRTLEVTNINPFDVNDNMLVASSNVCASCALTVDDSKCHFPSITKVIFNDPATIVWFADGTKVIVKKSESDVYSKEHALLYAIVKRLYGKVLSDGTVEPNGFMTYLKRLVENGIDQPALAKKAAEEKKAKKHEVPVNHPKTKNVVSVDSSSTNVSKQKYYAKKSNPKHSV